MVKCARASGVSELVRDFEVADEKTSAVRYLARMTVRFREDAVRTLLREHGVARVDEEDEAGLGEALADRGYAAFSVQYRLVPDARFPAQLDDVEVGDHVLVAHAEQAQRVVALARKAGMLKV